MARNFIYIRRIADVVLLDQWDDVIYANVCESFQINTSVGAKTWTFALGLKSHS